MLQTDDFVGSDGLSGYWRRVIREGLERCSHRRLSSVSATVVSAGQFMQPVRVVRSVYRLRVDPLSRFFGSVRLAQAAFCL